MKIDRLIPDNYWYSVFGNPKLILTSGLVFFVSMGWILVHEIMHSIPCYIWDYNVASISFFYSAQAVCGGIENSTSLLHRFTVGWMPYIFNILVLYLFSKRDWNRPRIMSAGRWMVKSMSPMESMCMADCQPGWCLILSHMRGRIEPQS